MKNSRLTYLVITAILVLVGLGSRKFSAWLPGLIAPYVGDTLWAAMVYFGLRFLFPLVTIGRISIAALLFSYGIEISQLYKADWINVIRNTTLGALVLGHGFLWSDIVCYTVGIALATISDIFIKRKKQNI